MINSVQAQCRYDGVHRPYVAIAHDYLTQRGGAEKVVLSMSRAFPDAPIHALLFDPANTYPEFLDRDVRVSSINHVAPLRKHHRVALPVLALAARTMFIDADVVLVSSSGWAHGIRTSGRKLVYCYTPARWLYLPDQYLGEHGGAVKRIALKAVSPHLRRWDRRAAHTAHKYLAISTTIRQRIHDTYGISADVVHAPVAMSVNVAAEPVTDVLNWRQHDDTDGFYLCVSRLLPYKNVDRIVRAVTDSRRRLVVVGAGPEKDRLSAIAPPNVLMLSGLSDGQMSWLYRNCRALVTSSYEDYGLTPIEANRFGKPTITLRWGGFLDTVDEGVTGVYFDQPEPFAIAEALDRFEESVFDGEAIKYHARKFTEDRFAQRLYAAVDEVAVTR